MKLEGEYTFDGPREEVWKLVRDPDVLVTALPGAQKLEQVAENEYDGQMNLRVGPVAGVFEGRLVVSEEQPPESCTLMVEGKGSPGFVKGTGHVNLDEIEDGKTRMKYAGEVQVGGRLASVGQRLIDTASKSMIRQGLDTLNQALQARVTGESQEELDYQPPTEAEFAASVAKDMAGEMFSSRRVRWIVIAIVIILAVLIVIWLNLGGG